MGNMLYTTQGVENDDPELLRRRRLSGENVLKRSTAFCYAGTTSKLERVSESSESSESSVSRPVTVDAAGNETNSGVIRTYSPRNLMARVLPVPVFTFADHLGTPILLTNIAGSVVWRAEYEPFGNIHEMRAGSRHDQPLRFPGQDLAMTWEGYEESYNVFRWYRVGGGGIHKLMHWHPVGSGTSSVAACHDSQLPLRRHVTGSRGHRR
jgi:uncharacterized protein RhaS with RHS repeats